MVEKMKIDIFELEEYLPLKKIKRQLTPKKVFIYDAIEKKIELKKRNDVDYVVQNTEQIELGYCGEEFVFSEEKRKVKSYNLPNTKEVVWVSKDEGDGLGYDIRSYNKKGEVIYIEVKTTSGKEKSSFYITANELLKSQQEAERYFLYRVYNFDMDQKRGEISVIRGRLDDYCIVPLVYRVDFE